MKFHTVVTVAMTDDVTRKDWTVDAATEEVASLYRQNIPDLSLKLTFVTVPFVDININACVLESTRRGGAAIVNLEVEGALGMGGLILGGKNGEVDQQYAKKFMKKCAVSQKWRLPLPPLEVESRPLFYYAVYRLPGGPSGRAWFNLVDRVIAKANGLGLALLRSTNCIV